MSSDPRWQFRCCKWWRLCFCFFFFLLNLNRFFWAGGTDAIDGLMKTFEIDFGSYLVSYLSQPPMYLFLFPVIIVFNEYRRENKRTHLELESGRAVTDT